MARLAIVTGGTRGIGKAVSIALKDHGFVVVANYHRNHEAAEEIAGTFGIRTRRWDVSKYAECAEAVKAIESEFGMSASVLVNNAGITRDAFLHKMDPEAWREVIDVNLNSCFNMSRAVINPMRNQAYGRIINISSINAQVGQLGQANYSASNAGIIGFTKALARESAGKNVTVNCICPGYTDTDMVRKMPEKVLGQIVSAVPMRRLGEPEEIARAVLYLAGEDAGFITGETLSINGGGHMP
jgi:acetoacetyl-CoA reductase